MIKNKNKFIGLSSLLSLISTLVFLVLSIICYAVATNPNGESLDGLAIILVILITAPCMVACLLAFVFNLITFLTNKVWGAIVGSVITSITTIYLAYLSVDASPVILVLVVLHVLITIFSIIGTAKQKRINNNPKNENEP